MLYTAAMQSSPLQTAGGMRTGLSRGRTARVEVAEEGRER